MTPYRKQKIVSCKHQTVFSCHITTLGVILNVNSFLVILGLTFLPLNQKLIRNKAIPKSVQVQLLEE